MENIAEKVVAHHRDNGGMSRYEKFTFYHKEYLNKDITNNELDVLDKQFSSYIVDKVVNANEIAGVSNFLEKICLSNNCYICSATPVYEVREIVRLRGWDHLFCGVLGSPTTKSDNLKEIIRCEKVNSEKVIFFGDAVADYEAAIKCNVDFVAIGKSWDKYKRNRKIMWQAYDFNSLLE